MSLSLNKKINFFNRAKHNTIEDAAPVLLKKRHMNLMSPLQRKVDPKNIVIATVLALLVLFCVGKFGIYDLYANVFSKQLQLQEQQAILARANVELNNYDAVLAEYQSYISSADANSNANTLTVLNMIIKVCGKDTQITSIDITQDDTSIGLSGISIKKAGALAARFEKQDIVKEASLSNVGKDTLSDKNIATITLALVNADDQDTDS